MMRKAFISLLLSTLVPLASAEPLYRPAAPTQRSAPNTRTILGRVFTNSPHPLGLAIEVRLEGEASQRLATTYTRSDGTFRFSDAPRTARNIYVVVELEGYERVRERVRPGAQFQDFMSIFLRPTAIKRKASAPRTGGGDNPNLVDLRQLESKIPQEAVEASELAREAAQEGRHERAAERLEQALALAPEFYEAQVNLGNQYLALDRLREAEAAFLKASELNPVGALPLINLGALYLQEGEGYMDEGQPEQASVTFQRAAASLNQATLMHPQSATAHYFFGVALYKTGFYEEAESALDRALEINRELRDAHLMLTNVHVKRGDLESALEEITTYLESQPSEPQLSAAERIKSQIEAAIP